MPAIATRVLPIVAAACAAAALVGCGSGSSGETTTAGAAAAGTAPTGRPAPTDAQRGQFDKLRSCLKQHGVELPEPGGQAPGAGAAPPQIDPAAIRACARYAPQGGPPGAGGPPPAAS